MIFSFLPRQQLRPNSAGLELDGSVLYRCYAQLDPTSTSVADILKEARAKFHDHLMKRAVYYKLSLPSACDADMASVLAHVDGNVKRRVLLLAGEDSVLSDAVIGQTHETCLSATAPPCDGLYFSVMPSDVCLSMLLNLTSEQRARLIKASPHMRRVWAGYVFFDVTCDELFFEVADYSWSH